MIAVEREAHEAVGEGDQLGVRLNAAIASAERVIALIERTDPLLMQMMSPLRTRVPDVRRSVGIARELVGELCRRAAA